MNSYTFVLVDVFTERPLAGNQLAVILNAEGLDDGQLQAIAREFNYSESTFILPPRQAKADRRLRSFTPKAEVFGIGHHTLGAWWALAARGGLDLLGFATVLTFAAIVGKQVCSLAVIERPINRLAIGLGMIPRGEVGLIFAGIGATLTLPNAQGVSEPVVGAATFGSIVIMVIITTLVTPPLLKWSLDRAPSVWSHPTVEL